MAADLHKKPEIFLANDGAVLRVYTALATEIDMTPSIILMEIEYLIRKDKTAYFKDGAWWIDLSTRNLRSRLDKCISPDTINRAIQQLVRLKLLTVVPGQKASDPRKISLNIEGIRKLKSVFVKTDGADATTKKDSLKRMRAMHKARKQTQKSAENTADETAENDQEKVRKIGHEPVRLSDTGNDPVSENQTRKSAKSDTELDESPQNQTRKSAKSDSIEVLEDLKAEDTESLSGRESDEKKIDPQFAAAIQAFNKIRRGSWTAQESELLKSDLDEFGFEKVIWAIEQATGRTPASWRYCHTILVQQAPSPSSGAPPPQQRNGARPLRDVSQRPSAQETEKPVIRPMTEEEKKNAKHPILNFGESA